MRIAFDGKKAARNMAGLGNYSRFVIKSLARRFPDVRFDVYISRKGDSRLLESLREFPNISICYPTHPVLRHFPKLWERYGIPYELNRSGADVFHGLGNVLPANIRKNTKTLRNVSEPCIVPNAVESHPRVDCIRSLMGERMSINIYEQNIANAKKNKTIHLVAAESLSVFCIFSVIS